MINPKVSVICTTFNHEDYISQALESILTQKVKFHYEIIIQDDASTDNNQRIIKSYQKNFPNIIKPIFYK